MERWSGKRYHSWSWHLQSVFGEKVAKISLDAGFTCPHRRGTSGGCIYCSPRGSGDFTGEAGKTIPAQFQEMAAKAREKWPEVRKFIAYFQAYTNTLAPVSQLESLYNQALEQEGVVGLSISTRPDCLPRPVLDLLAQFNKKTWLWVELGLQSSHDSTLRRINRSHDYASFVEAVENLKERGIRTCAHIILGLPGETEEMMLQTARALAAQNLEGIKIHLLNVIKNTPLAEMWKRGQVPLPDMATYARWVADILELLPPEMVIHRLTGDSPAPLLLAPAWSLRKWEVLMAIEGELKRRETWQGKKYLP
ncbi:MAG: TIGR01212 family radical SAM protein [Firmicutes bacterium]|nr:TIGR01212 family radical SAM protein [Bacillota bacterium]